MTAPADSLSLDAGASAFGRLMRAGRAALGRPALGPATVIGGAIALVLAGRHWRCWRHA